MNNSTSPNNNVNPNNNIEQLNVSGNVPNNNVNLNGNVEQLNVSSSNIISNSNVEQLNVSQNSAIFNSTVEQPSVQGSVPNNNVSINTVSNPIGYNTSSVNTQSVQSSQVVQNNQVMQAAPVVSNSQSTPNTSTVGPNNQMDINNIPPMQEVVIDPTPPKKGKYFMTIFLFIALLAIVYFLPEISTYVKTLKAEKQQNSVVITTGVLKCSLSRSSDNFDYVYEQDFAFTDSKLTKLTYTVETRGDMSLDEEALDEMSTNCNTLSLAAKQLDGVAVSCDLTEGTMTEKQVFNYQELDVEEVNSAFIEAGGIYPDYENGEDIDYLEKNMKASGYSCERIK